MFLTTPFVTDASTPWSVSFWHQIRGAAAAPLFDSTSTDHTMLVRADVSNGVEIVLGGQPVLFFDAAGGAGLCADLLNPYPLGSALMDATDQAALTLTASVAPGTAMYFQAAHLDGDGETLWLRHDGLRPGVGCSLLVARRRRHHTIAIRE